MPVLCGRSIGSQPAKGNVAPPNLQRWTSGRRNSTTSPRRRRDILPLWKPLVSNRSPKTFSVISMQRAEGLTALAKSVAHSRISRSHCPCHPARFDGEFCIDATSQIGPRSRSLQCLRHHGCEQPVLPRCDDPNPQRQQGTTRQPATHVIRQTPAAASLRATRLGGRTLVTRTMPSANCGRMPQPLFCLER